MIDDGFDRAKLDMPGVLHLEVTMKWKKSRHDDSDQETQKQLAQSSAAPALHVSGQEPPLVENSSPQPLRALWASTFASCR